MMSRFAITAVLVATGAVSLSGYGQSVPVVTEPTTGACPGSSPLGCQTVVQPTGTVLGVNDLNNVLDATQFGSINTGASSAGAQPSCLPLATGALGQGCLILADSAYPQTDLSAFLWSGPIGTNNFAFWSEATPSLYSLFLPAQSHLVDYRGGTQSDAFLNPVNFLQGSFTTSSSLAGNLTFSPVGMAHLDEVNYTQPYGNSKIVPAYRVLNVYYGTSNWYYGSPLNPKSSSGGALSLEKEDVQNQIDVMAVYSNSQAIGGQSWSLTSLKG